MLRGMIKSQLLPFRFVCRSRIQSLDSLQHRCQNSKFIYIGLVKQV